MKTIAVDFDGTIAKYDGLEGVDYKPSNAGAPIELMVERVKMWLAEGVEVVILTARVHSSRPAKEIHQCVTAINRFCNENFGRELEITSEKHPRFSEIWDDKAVRVLRDAGTISDGTDVDDPLVQSADAIGSFLED